MCFNLVRDSMGKWTGAIQWSSSRTVKALGVIALTIGSITVIQTKCNSSFLYAQDRFVTKKSAEVFDSLHKPIELANAEKIIKLTCALDSILLEIRTNNLVQQRINPRYADLYWNAREDVICPGKIPARRVR